MSDCISLVLVSIGVALNLVGIYLSGRALRNAWRAYRSEPIWPRATRTLVKTKNIIRKLAFWSKIEERGLSVSDKIGIKLHEKSFVCKRISFEPGVSESERVNRLEKAFTYIYEVIDKKEMELSQQHQRLSESLNKLEEQVNKESKRLEAFSKDAVTGDVRLQLIGLILVGLGTLFIAAPTICSLIVQLELL